MRLPFNSFTDVIGESMGTIRAVCSRIEMASSFAGRRAEATIAGPMPADAI